MNELCLQLKDSKIENRPRTLVTAKEFGLLSVTYPSPACVPLRGLPAQLLAYPYTSPLPTSALQLDLKTDARGKGNRNSLHGG